MARQGPPQPVILPFQTPWNGYTPDLAIPASALNGLVSSQSVVALSGVLTIDHGWARVDGDTLPLGHTFALPAAYNDGVTAYGRGDAPAALNAIQPVKHIASYQRFTAGAGQGESQIAVITADTRQAPAETGHLFLLQSGAWTSREFNSRDGGGAIVSGSAPLSGHMGDWVDSTVYQLGVTGATVGGETILQVLESVFIFTNFRDNVMYFPDATAGINYTDFRSYATQVDDAGNAADYYSGTSSIFTTLVAKTLATFDGRVWYGNTVEGGNNCATRLRRSIVGNPFIVWPGFEIEHSVGPVNLNGVGSGFIDLEQFETPIQRILPLGDVLCVYSSDGISFVRRTGNNAAPYAIQYITLDRGLMAPGAVVPINPAQHFAILNDGWYIINANGTLQEVGVTSAGTVLTGRTGEANYKWKTNFYSRLSADALADGTLQVGYDAQEQFVRIAVAMGDGIVFTDDSPEQFATANEVWIYDLKNDRVWTDSYELVNGVNGNPTCWANTVSRVGEVITWAEVTATDASPWSSITDVGSWASITPRFGGSVVTHGDLNGLVLGHDSDLDTRDEEEVNWSFTTVPHNLKVPGAREKMLQRVDLQYMNAENDTSPTLAITVYGFSNDSGAATSAVSSESTTIDITRGNENEIAQDYAHFKVTADHHALELSGTGKIKIHSIDVEVQPLEGRYRRREGT